MPNIADLPLDVVGSTLEQLVLTDGRRAMQYGSGQGEPAIRDAICEVMQLEGIDAHPDDVTVTVGKDDDPQESAFHLRHLRPPTEPTVGLDNFPNRRLDRPLDPPILNGYPNGTVADRAKVNGDFHQKTPHK